MKRRFTSSFLIVVLSLTVLPSFLVFYVPTVKAFDGSNGEYGNWSWDGTNKILTIVANASAGDTEAHAYAFIDVVNAIEYYNWTAYYNLSYSERQFEFDFRIVNGDGSTTTWFKDNGKQVLFTNTSMTGNSQKQIQVKNHAHLIFGILEDASKKSTSDGVMLEALRTYLYGNFIYGDSGSDVQLYSSSFHGVEGEQRNTFGLFGSTARIWNCLFHGCQLQGATNLDVYNVQLFDPYDGFVYGTAGGTYDTIYISPIIHRAFYFYSDRAITVRNVVAKNFLQAQSISVYSITEDNYLINANLEKWSIYWGGDSTAEIYRQSTLNVRLHYENGTDFEDANVTLTYHGNGGGTVGSWLTNSTGQIPQQIVTIGFYNETGGDTIYSYNPYNVRITNGGYQTKEWNFTIMEQENWNFAMFPEEEPETSTEYIYDFVTPMGMGLSLSIVFGIVFGIVIMKRRGTKEEEEYEFD